MLRGGSWQDSPQHCRSASCYELSADLRSDSNGFRVIYSVEIEDSDSQLVDVEALCRSLSDKYARGELNEVEQIVSDALKSHLDNLNIDPEPESSYSYEVELVEIKVLRVAFNVLEPPNQIFRDGDSDEGVVIEAEVNAEVNLEYNFFFTANDMFDHEDAIGANNKTIEADLEVYVLMSLIDESDSADSADEKFEVIEIEITNLSEIDWGFVDPDWGDSEEDDHDWDETENNNDSNRTETEMNDNLNQSNQTDIDLHNLF